MIFIILFFVIPVIEIALFIQIGGIIGAGYTLLLCALTAIIGGGLCRHQGLRVINDFQKRHQMGHLALNDLYHGICILMAGLLLMTPGFATDMLGFLLFIPAIRRIFGEFALSSFGLSPHIFSSREGTQNSRNNGDIDGEYTRMDIDPDIKNQGQNQEQNQGQNPPNTHQDNLKKLNKPD